MAEAVAQHWLESDRGAAALPTDAGPYLFASAGVAAGEGMSTAAEAVEALARTGISFKGRSKQLTAEMIREATAVLCMTAGHVAAAKALAGTTGDAGKIAALDPAGDIPDPIGMGQATYDAVAARLAALVPRRVLEVLGHADRAGLGSSRS